MHTERMSEHTPFEHERQIAGYDVQTIYDILDKSKNVIDEEVLQDAEEAAGKMLEEAHEAGRKIMVMVRAGQGNLFMQDDEDGSYELMQDDEMVYGHIEAIHHEQGRGPQPILRLFAFIRMMNDRDEPSHLCALNMANEGATVPLGNRMTQVTEPSLEIEYVNSQADARQGIQWQSFANIVCEWFDDGKGFISGRELTARVRSEVLARNLDLDEFVTAINYLINPGGYAHMPIEASVMGFAHRFQYGGLSGDYGGMVPHYYGNENIQPVLAFDFFVREDDHELTGYIYRYNNAIGHAERVDLDYSQVGLRFKEA
jgi:hypothetical protein